MYGPNFIALNLAILDEAENVLTTPTAGNPIRFSKEVLKSLKLRIVTCRSVA